MGRRGPVGKSAVELKLHGTYRSDRHEKRAIAEAALDGIPVKPARLKGEAGAWWSRNVPQLVASGRVKALDADWLAMIAELYADYRNAKQAGERRQAFYAFRVAYEELAATPKGRARVAGEAARPVDDPDNLDAFARKRG